MSSLNTLLAIFIEPGKAMAAVRERSMILLPLALMLLGNVAIMVWYYNAVDFPWLQDYLIASMGDVEPAAREAARGFMQKGTLTVTAAVGVLVFIPVVLALLAVYYLLAAKVVGNDLEYGKWFAFSVWTSVPALLLIPIAAVQILLSGNGQLAPEAMNPLTFNQLIFGLPSDSPWAGLLNALNLTTLWCWVVAVIGMKLWTGKSTAVSTAIVMLPQVLVFGGWAAFAAMRAAA